VSQNGMQDQTLEVWIQVNMRIFLSKIRKFNKEIDVKDYLFSMSELLSSHTVKQFTLTHMRQCIAQTAVIEHTCKCSAVCCGFVSNFLTISPFRFWKIYSIL